MYSCHVEKRHTEKELPCVKSENVATCYMQPFLV